MSCLIQIHSDSLQTVEMFCEGNFPSVFPVYVCVCVCVPEFAKKSLTTHFARVGICWWPHSFNLKPTDWMAIPQCPSSLSPQRERETERETLGGWIVRSIVSVRCLLMRGGAHTDTESARAAIEGLIANLFVNTGPICLMYWHKLLRSLRDGRTCVSWCSAGLFSVNLRVLFRLCNFAQKLVFLFRLDWEKVYVCTCVCLVFVPHWAVADACE